MSLTTEDFTEFFDTDDFGVAATYNSTTVNGHFKRGYVMVNGVEMIAPIFTCPTISGVKNGDFITISGTVYEVLEPQPDESGYIQRLVLNEA